MSAGPTRRRVLRGLAFWGVLAAFVSAAIVWRARDLRTELEEEVDRSHAVTTRALLVTITAWGQVRAAHAEAMAEWLADEPALAARGAPADALLAARFGRVMAALARRETFVGGWVLDGAGRVLAHAGVEVAPGARDVIVVAATTAADAGVRAVTVPCGRGHCIAFRAPVRTQGTVVLLAAVDDSTFRPLNPARPQVRTGRTSLLAPLGGPVVGAPAGALVVLASVGAPESPEPAVRRASADAPAHVRRALAAAPTGVATGRGPGLHGAVTHYAVARVPGLDWVVLREFDRAEILDVVRRILLVEEPILVTLLVSLLVLGRNRLRVRRARRAQELTRLRADFVASTSHELRTPLAQIRMFAELLQKGALHRPDEAARALRIIEKEASRLTILVDNLLNYARLRRRADDDDALAAVAPTHVADDVQHVLDAFAPLAAERGARVVSAVPAGLHARVDSLALRQVLTNYLENAVKYGPAGQAVTVGAAAAGRRVRVWVDDEGDGVPPDEREAIWIAFRRGRRAEASARGGSGIGLAVVRELVLQYGGTVRVEDAPRGGARFVAEFPQAAAGAAH